MKNKCPKTMSGNHIFKKYYDGVDEEETKKVNEKSKSWNITYVPKFIIKCQACEMVDDRNIKHKLKE